MATLSDRLQAVIDYKNITITEFERETKVSKGVFAKAIKNNTGVTSVVLEKIISIIPEVNLNWLLTGQGDMLIKDYGRFLYEENDRVSIISAPEATYGKEESGECDKLKITAGQPSSSALDHDQILLSIMNNISEAMRRNAIANENNSISMKDIMAIYSGEKKR